MLQRDANPFCFGELGNMYVQLGDRLRFSYERCIEISPLYCLYEVATFPKTKLCDEAH